MRVKCVFDLLVLRTAIKNASCKKTEQLNAFTAEKAPDTVATTDSTFTADFAWVINFLLACWTQQEFFALAESLVALLVKMVATMIFFQNKLAFFT